MVFINSEQRDPSANEILHPYCNREDAIQIISKYERCKEMVKQGRLSADGLSRYLMSDESLCVNAEMFDVCQDMNQPLCHYFINSSHNTYLIGKWEAIKLHKGCQSERSRLMMCWGRAAWRLKSLIFNVCQLTVEIKNRKYKTLESHACINIVSMI